jgi:hypothetical protein
MKSWPHLLFSFCLFFAFAPPTTAQEKLTHTVTTSYDRFREVTTTTLEEMLLVLSYDYNLHLSAGFPCKGQTTCKPESVVLLFALTTKGKYQGAGIIRMIRDDVLFPPYTLKRLGVKQNEEWYREILGVTLSPSAFTNIANGKKVEFQIDNYEFSFKESHLVALRDIVSRMAK